MQKVYSLFHGNEETAGQGTADSHTSKVLYTVGM